MILHLSLVQFSLWILSNSLSPHGLQHAKLPCPSPIPGAYSNSCPSSWWFLPSISSSVILFSSCHQFPTSRSLHMSQLFMSGGQIIGVSPSGSVLPMNIQDWFPLAQAAASRCTKPGWEELPHIRGQRQQPRVPGCVGAGMAERSYPASEVSGGREETPRVQCQGGGQEVLPHVRSQCRLGGDTLHLRSGAAGKSHFAPEARHGDPEKPHWAWDQG